MSFPSILNTPLDAVSRPTTFSPTAEQAAIINAAAKGDNLMIKAFAGCTKTTTLRLIAESGVGPGLCLAFNVKIKKELERVFPPGWDILTLNGLGHRAWGRTIAKRLTLDAFKLSNIARDMFPAKTERERGEQQNLVALVDKAMTMGLVPATHPQFDGILADVSESWFDLADTFWLTANDEIVRRARLVLAESIRQSYTGLISFADQLYMPTFFHGQFPTYACVMGDEVQDWSVSNQRMVAKTVKRQLILVGDPLQAIYQFRGADSAAMENARGLRPTWTDLALTQTWRCPKLMVDRQQTHAPGFAAAHTNAQGTFLNLQGTEWSRSDVASWPRPVAMLCRNNAPLLSMAFKLLRAGLGVQVLGRDIGSALQVLTKKVIPDPSVPKQAAHLLIEVWRDNEIAKANRQDKPGKIPGIEDRAECLAAVLDAVASTSQMLPQLKLLFDEKSGPGIVTLATGHRAKGLEWQSVVHLDPWRLPSRYAIDDLKQMEQERNLMYVIETRTKDTFILANVGEWA